MKIARGRLDGGVSPFRDLRHEACVRGLLVAVALGVATVGSACSGAAAVDRGTIVGVTLRDFHITLARSSVSAGQVTFRIRNHGPSTHEFNVDRTSLAAKALSLRKDGITVDEDSKQLNRISSVEEIFDGHKADLTVALTKGHYVLYCNMEGHYMGNMRASIDVR